MTKFIIKGGKKLSGKVTVSGSKNAALPILCATLLSTEKSVLSNVPDIADIRSMIALLENFGARVTFSQNTLTIDPSNLKKNKIPHHLVARMRASILIIGGVIARFREIKMDFPGGCVLGKRSVWAHTHAFRELGCKIIDDTKTLHLKCSTLKGADITLPELSVTATENAIMTATLANGTTTIRLAAIEPHVVDLCHFLQKMGAKISGIGTHTLKITGVQKLKGAKYKITGDYLEAGTFAIISAVTNSPLTIDGINPDDLNIFWQKLKETGSEVKIKNNSVEILPSKHKTATSIKTATHPGFPTDIQAPFAVLLTQCQGTSQIFETLFEGRMNYLFELEKMGAKVELLNPHQAQIMGSTPLKAVPISSCDIRAGAAMVVAALIANGVTEISDIYYIDRGYENFEKKLRAIGADITRS